MHFYRSNNCCFHKPSSLLPQLNLANQWTMVTLVCGTDNLPKLYLNGTLSRTGVNVGVATRTAVFRVGGASSGTSGFSGTFDELSTCNTSLSDAEIAALMTLSLVPPAPVSPCPGNSVCVCFSSLSCLPHFWNRFLSHHHMIKLMSIAKQRERKRERENR
jgi:hypothetical protein